MTETVPSHSLHAYDWLNSAQAVPSVADVTIQPEHTQNWPVTYFILLPPIPDFMITPLTETAGNEISATTVNL